MKERLIVANFDELAQRWQMLIERVEFLITDCGIDIAAPEKWAAYHTDVHYILKGARHPRRDVIIALGFAYDLSRVEVDEILLLAGFPPLGRTSLREYRQARQQRD